MAAGTFKKLVAEQRVEGEKVFQEGFAMERKEADKQFKEASLAGEDDGAHACSDMIIMACQTWDEFCDAFSPSKKIWKTLGGRKENPDICMEAFITLLCLWMENSDTSICTTYI